MSPYDEAIYGSWEKDFTLINWDQRGAGRTFGRYAPAELDEDYLIENPLTVERMVEDGIELTEYLLNHLKKDKVILIGTSWGSILGTEMVLNRPDLFYAYIGHAQFVNFAENMKYAYQKVLQMAKETKDDTSIQTLGALGKPPYAEAKNSGQFLRIVKEYERKNSVPAPENWWKLAAEYNNEKDSKDRYDGDDYSFINLVGHEKLGIKSMVANIDFAKDGLVFKVPVYLIQGEADILTAKEINGPYFDKIIAPDKAYFLLPGAGHGHNQSVFDKQFQILKEKLSF
jgi:pimeloyl-ACP methyl ester carboxylesterase